MFLNTVTVPRETNAYKLS